MSDYSKLHRLIAVILVVTLLTTGVTTVSAWNAEKEIHLTINGESESIITKAVTVGELLEDIDCTVDENTEINLPIEIALVDQLEIDIIQKRTVHLIQGDIELSYKTDCKTVSDFLEMNDIKVSENQSIYPTLDTYIRENLEIYIDTVKKETNIIEENIPYEVEYVETSNLYEGEEELIQEGVNGRKKITETIYYHNGQASAPNVHEYIVEEAQKEIIEIGTAIYVEPSNYNEANNNGYVESSNSSSETSTSNNSQSSSTSSSSGWMTFEATAYDPTVGDTTAMGTPARVGIIAVDPSVIPLGSRVEIQGYGVFTAEDTGGAIKGNIIDIFMATNAEAWAFGRRSVQIRILN